MRASITWIRCLMHGNGRCRMSQSFAQIHRPTEFISHAGVRALCLDSMVCVCAPAMPHCSYIFSWWPARLPLLWTAHKSQNNQNVSFSFSLFPSRRLHFVSIIVHVSADEVSALEPHMQHCTVSGRITYAMELLPRYDAEARRRKKQRKKNKARRMKKIINCSCKSEWMHH